MDEKRWTHRNLNPRGLPSPVRLEKFSRWNLTKMFRTLGYRSGAEIGVERGKYSERICRQNPGVFLLCVDTWAVYEGSRHRLPQEKHDRIYAEARARLAPLNTKMVRGFSMDVVRDIPIESLDFVYIDANHAFDYVMQDIIEWSKRVRSGGIVAGHDFYRFRRAGVVNAVQAYVEAHGIKEWFLTNEGKAKSWFWVKR